jgi:hypothetical protein
MDRVVVIVVGGARYIYEAGSTFCAGEHWLTVNGTGRTPVAVFAQHRVVRAYYSNADGSEKDMVGMEATG